MPTAGGDALPVRGDAPGAGGDAPGGSGGPRDAAARGTRDLRGLRRGGVNVVGDQHARDKARVENATAPKFDHASFEKD